MFIESLKVSYPSEGWSLEETKFDRFNLLVGASGVGKSMILKSILELVELARANGFADNFPHDNMNWELSFKTKNGIKYVWEGFVRAWDTRSPFRPEVKGVDVFFQAEKIHRNGKVVAQRKEDRVTFAGMKTPKMPNNQSLFSLFREEDLIGEGFNALTHVINSNDTALNPVITKDPSQIELGEGLGLQDIRNSTDELCLKINWLESLGFEEGNRVFKKIEEDFKNVFPFVTHLRTGINDRQGYFYAGIFLSENWQEYPQQVELEFFSSGMKKTLELLAQVELCPDNSLILIDEFENSLGANCISFVTDAIQFAKRGLQFIVTSHHPYIINNVDFKHWKIVTRNKGTVSTKPALEYGLGQSRHQNFFQLINLEAFQTGGMVEE